MKLADNVCAVLDLAHPIGVNAGFVVTTICSGYPPDHRIWR